MKALHKTAFVLVIIGALNWGIMGLTYYFGNSWNLVYAIFGQWSWLENLIYLLVGISALVVLFKGKKHEMAPQGQGM